MLTFNEAFELELIIFRFIEDKYYEFNGLSTGNCISFWEKRWLSGDSATDGLSPTVNNYDI